MEMIFLKLFSMGINASWMMIAAIVLRLFLKKAPKWLPCILWAMVAVRLLCPISFESSFSLIPNTETTHSVSVPHIQKEQNTIDTYNIPFIDNAVNPSIHGTFIPSIDGNATANSDSLHLRWSLITSILWFAGLVCFLLYALISFLRIRRKVQEAVPLWDNIWLCDTVKSPFILGIIKPQIYLSSSTKKEQIAYILAHEQAHLKRKDHWWKPLGYLLLAIYWFHPLVWAAYILFCRDIELACDEKVIKSMDMNEKKAYSHALVACSIQRKLMTVCPLAFGEVGVRKRVESVLNYKKPAFWLVIIAILACIITAICFLTNPKNNTYRINIVIPAGSKEPFHYSEEEISPNKDKIIISSDRGLGDTEVVLDPIEKKEGDDYKPTYITPGMPVKMDAEKNAWFRIGVAVSNPTDHDMTVSVEVNDVEIRKRIETKETGYKSKKEKNAKEFKPEASITFDLEEAISAAILEKNTSLYSDRYDYACCDFVMLEMSSKTLPETSLESSATRKETTTRYIITCYGWALYEEYKISKKGIREVSGSHIPIVLTFEQKEDNYELKEYWEPRSGSYYASDIEDKFPAHIVKDGMDSQKFIVRQIQSCYEQAVKFSGIDPNTIISSLLDSICSDPKASSNPQDYIDAHDMEYRELIYYNQYTLRYCLRRFHNGNETGLDGKIMAIVCEELLQTKGSIPADADTAETGQFWYDTLWAHGSNKVEPYIK